MLGWGLGGEVKMLFVVQIVFVALDGLHCIVKYINVIDV